MIEKITEKTLKYPGLVLLLLVVVTGLGIRQAFRMPVDAFPDISPIMVPVFAEAHGMAPEEVERLITYPIESAMNGLPKVTQIKSTSAFGLAVVYVYFDEDVDIYFARQLVSQRLSSIMGQLPKSDEPPTLGPISTGLGQVFIYYLTADPKRVDTGGKKLDTWLRELNDWVVKYQLQTVPGVADVLSMGGQVLQYQIQIDPFALKARGIPLESVVEAVRSNNRNVGAQFIVQGSEEYLVRGVGLLVSLDQLRKIPVKWEAGKPVLLEQVARVAYGDEVRRGVVTRNGKEEVVSGIVMKLYGENTSQVIDRLYKKVADVSRTLPAGVRLVPYYEQAELVSKATGTVTTSLVEGALLVVLVLILFLGQWRSSIIVAIAFPICALSAILLMGWTGLSANLMSLGGISIAIGMLGDGSIVMVENIYRRLGEGRDGRCRSEIVLGASREVGRPIVFSIIIIVMVFLPLFTLEGVEGKMFSPLAYTLCYALFGSLVVALTVAPVLSLFLLEPKKAKPVRFMEFLKRLYKPLLESIYRAKRVIMVSAVAIFLISLLLLNFVGTEFMPTLEEGSLMIGVTMAPSISLEKATSTVMELEKRIVRFPEVKETVSRIGRPEAGSHPHPVNYAEVHIELKPYKVWRFKNKRALIEALNKELRGIPGIQFNFTQPIQNAFDELISGVKTQLAVKLFGEDLTVLRQKSGEIKEAIETVPGLVDLSVEQNYGQPQVQVVADRERCARYGIGVSQVLETLELAAGGEVIDTLYLNTRRFGIHLRAQERFRKDTEALENLLLTTPSGESVRLGQVAKVEEVLGPIQINREKNQRRWTIQGNIRGRDMGSVVHEIRERIRKNVKLPPGYTVEYGGQFENQRRAMGRLALIVPIVILCVFLMLLISFNSFRHALIILINVPLSLAGGVFGLLIMGEYLSVPASIGFIALFGIAVQNGMVLVSLFNDLRAEGKSVEEAVKEGALLRLRPVLMTALTTVIGLLPLLVSRGIGAEVQRPLASVVIFGLTTSTFLTLAVIPAVYGLVEEWAAGKAQR